MSTRLNEKAVAVAIALSDHLVAIAAGAVKLITPAQFIDLFRGQANGVASLDVDRKVPTAQMPAYVETVAGRSGAVALSSADLTDLAALVASILAAAPVQTVSGRTGDVMISTTDLAGMTAYIRTLAADADGAAARATLGVVIGADVQAFHALTPQQFGAVDLTGAAFSTAPFAAALAAGGDIVLKPGTYKLAPVTVSVNRTRLICAPGVTLSFPVVGTGVAAITVAANDFAIIGRPVIEGPAGAAYVADENGIQMIGTSSAARRSGLRIDAEIKHFGSAAVFAKWVDNIRIGGGSHFHDVGYAGGMFLSCDHGVIESGARVSTIAPGTSGNAYGFALSHVSSGYDVDPDAGTRQAANPFCGDWSISAVLVENIFWTAIDAHGAYNIKVDGASVYNCKHGVHVAGGSGDSTDYGGWSNSVVNCLIDARKRDGSAGDHENTGIGVNVTVSGFPAAVKHQRVLVKFNLIIGYGVPDTAGGPAIGAANCVGVVIEGNVLQKWGGVGIELSGAQDVFASGNLFLELADSGDTQAYAIKSPLVEALRQTFSGNILDANGGTAARCGLYSRSTLRPLLNGNDFRAATVLKLDLPSVGFLLGTDAMVSKSIDLGAGGGTTTIDLAEFGFGTPMVTLHLTAGAPITVTNLVNAPAGLMVILRVAGGSSAITFNRANSALGGSADFVGGAYDAVTLQHYADSGGVRWIELARSANG